MMLKKLTLQNFRSYGNEPTTIELGQGILLFEGEIGSGKSSLLYAVEFALFGLGELESKYLIRGSAASALVELSFEIAGMDYKVTRTIERKRGSKSKQTQTKGWIEEPDGKKIEYAPTELRSRILQILNFREKQGSKSSSRIYRYAIFTPQELMKEVLSQSPEERIDTLRRAFGVEDYSFAGSNTELVAKRTNELRKTYTRLSEGVEEVVASLDENRRALSNYRMKSEKEESDLAMLEERLNDGKSSLLKLEVESKKVIQLETLIPELEKAIHALDLQAVETSRELEKQAKERTRIEKAERELATLRMEYENYSNEKERLRQLGHFRDESLSVESQISSLEAGISSKENSLRAQMASVEADYSSLQEKVMYYDEQVLSLLRVEQSAQDLKKKLEVLPQIGSNISETNVEIATLSTSIASSQAEESEARERLAKLGDLTRESECPLCGQKLDSDHLKKVRSEFNQIIASASSKVGESQERLSSLKERLRKLETQRDEHLETQRQLGEIEGRISLGQGILQLGQDAKQRLEQLELKKTNFTTELERREFASEEEAQLEQLSQRRESLAAPLSEFARLEASVRKFEDSGLTRSYQGAEIAVGRKEEVINSILSLGEKKALLDGSISEKATELETKRRDLENSEPTLLLYAKTKEEVDEFVEQRSELKKSVALLAKEIESQNREIQRLEGESNKLREDRVKAALYGGVFSWLEEYFLPAINEIESYVFSSINEDFNKLLQQFFSILVEEGDFTVTVDDGFTPIVEQRGYELDVNSLSGGERTAVALAYRLALNYMVKRANEAMHANLLILDEPTEGFSKEQIYRLRNVLSELNCDQVIIVTHERDLEAMADRVYRVEKVNGESVVSIAS